MNWKMAACAGLLALFLCVCPARSKGADAGPAGDKSESAPAAAAPDAAALEDPIALIKQGKSLMGAGDLDGAETALLRAYELGVSGNNAQARQFASMLLGKLYAARNNADKAIEYYGKAADAFAGQPQALSAIYYALADLCLASGKYADAIKNYGQAQAQFEAAGDGSRTALIQGGIALAHVQLGEYKEAETIYTALLESSRAAGDATGTVRILRNLGDIGKTRSEFDKALNSYTEALDLARGNGLAGDEIMILNSLALVHEARADLDAARASLDQALALAEAGADRAGLAATYHQLGILDLHAGEAGRAIEHYTKAADIKKDLRDPSLSNTLAETGRAYFFSGDYKQARKFYTDALKAGTSADAGITIENNMAMVYKMQGMLDYALETFTQALATARSHHLPYQTSALLNNIGVVLREQGALDQALEKHQEALGIDEQAGDRLGALVDRNNIAVVYKLQGEYAKALELLEPAAREARDIGSYDDYLRTLVNLGETYLLNSNFTGALEQFALGADLAEKTNNPERRWNALFGAGRVHEAQGGAEEAIAAYKDAVAVIETLRANIGGGGDEKTFFLADKVKVYVRLIKLLYLKGDYAEALRYLERMKSRSLLDLIQKGRMDIDKGMTPAEKEREKQDRIAVAVAAKEYAAVLAETGLDSPAARAAKQKLDDAKTQQDKARDALYKAHPELAFARGESEPITPEALQKTLEEGEVIAAYLLNEDTSYVWTITRDAVRMTDLQTPAEKIDFLVDTKLRSALEQGVWQKSQQRAAQKLYEMILAPIEKDLEGKTVLGIVPDGRLYELPFIVLMDANEQYLIDRVAVYYTPSLSVMAETRRARAALKNQDKVLAFANPTFAREDLAALPGTETEVQEIAALFGDRATVHFHEDALEDHIKRYAGGYRIVHLASHGLLNNNNPMFSSIALSQIKDQADDGYLQAREIPNIELDAELVIMSACESGRGRLQAGEGILGLTRSFFSAGVPGIAASLWEVNDTATSFLMRTFYSLYPATRSVDALRQAQLATRQEFGDNPNLWAPFLIMGYGVNGPPAQ